MRLSFFVAAISAACSQPALAAQSSIFLTGTLTEETSGGDPVPLGVGSTLTLKATFDPSTAVPWGDTGYKLVGFYGNGSFSITAGDYAWKPADEIIDGTIFYWDDTGRFPVSRLPAIAFKDGKVAGVLGWLAPVHSSTPQLQTGSYADGVTAYCEPFPQVCSNFSINLSDQFSLFKMNIYGNTYAGPDFNGKWNFSSSLAPVPEPSLWILMILGIGGIGAAMRRRRRMVDRHRLARVAFRTF